MRTFRLYWLREWAPKELAIDLGADIASGALWTRLTGAPEDFSRQKARAGLGDSATVRAWSGRPDTRPLALRFARMSPHRAAEEFDRLCAWADSLEDRLRAAGCGELHLPYSDRRDQLAGAARLEQIEFERSGPGLRPRCTPREQLLHCVQLMLGGCILRAFPRPFTLALPGGDMLVSSHLEAWLHLPPERGAAFGELAIHVSHALQRELRRRIPDIYFREERRLDMNPCARAMLVYSVTRPGSGRWRGDIAYDVLDPGLLNPLLRFLGRSLRERIAGYADRLREAGLAERAAKFQPEQLPDILRAVRQRPLLLEKLLAADRALAEETIRLMAAAPRVADYRGLKAAAEGYVNGLEYRLRRVLKAVDFRELAPELFATATRALAERASVRPLPAPAERLPRAA
ncbi:MAG: hypothetical protein K2X35_20525 [Bryobacteraceae bacterium]|nr:hypothetical protein [Bryobacteraceae bacterium]